MDNASAEDERFKPFHLNLPKEKEVPLPPEQEKQLIRARKALAQKDEQLKRRM